MQIDIKKLEINIAKSKKTAKEICQLAKIRENTFIDVRKGRSTPRAGTIGKIAEGIGCQVEDLIKDE